MTFDSMWPCVSPPPPVEIQSFPCHSAFTPQLQIGCHVGHSVLQSQKQSCRTLAVSGSSAQRNWRFIPVLDFWAVRCTAVCLSAVDGLLGRFQRFAIVNKVAVNLCAHVFVWTQVSRCVGTDLGQRGPAAWSVRLTLKKLPSLLARPLGTCKPQGLPVHRYRRRFQFQPS